MVLTRNILVKNSYEGLPKREDFEIVKEELPPLINGEILVKTEWVSVDPYLRIFAALYTTPFVQFGYQVGIVEDSRNPRFPVGTRVVSHKGWREYYITNPNDDPPVPFEKVYKLPNLGDLSASLGVGAVGMPGATAYFAFIEQCKPKAGETIVVSAAAGTVGSLVGQIAKIKGCKVIGFAGSDEKVKWLEKIGFDKAFNYKTVDITASLKEAAPNGVDIYFDNVGGEISSLIINQMADLGRVAVVGSTSSYNDATNVVTRAPILRPAIMLHQLNIFGFSVFRWLDQWPEAFAEIIKWIKSGQLIPKEQISEGFEKLPDTFIGLFKGENTGKAVVKI